MRVKRGQFSLLFLFSAFLYKIPVYISGEGKFGSLHLKASSPEVMRHNMIYSNDEKPTIRYPDRVAYH